MTATPELNRRDSDPDKTLTPDQSSLEDSDIQEYNEQLMGSWGI
jgi:hypothetical protein